MYEASSDKHGKSKAEKNESVLFYYVKTHYELITGIVMEESYDPNVLSGQCKKIWKWYDGMYSFGTTEPKGKSKSVNRTTDEISYSFHFPYGRAQFEKNLIDADDISPEVIEHMAVAFGFSIDECNDCLRRYGYLPLHAKNIHNLAIYSVLVTLKGNVNKYALRLVKQRYFKACDIIKKDTSSKKRESEDFKDTKLLEKEVFNKNIILDENNLFEYIRKNKAYLNWRHGALLDEHGRIIDVLLLLYVNIAQKKGSINTWKVWSDAELQYSLFSIFGEFFRKKGEHRKESGEFSWGTFKADLLDRIHTDGKKMSRENRHPTREVMIFLWLYVELFRGTARIPCPNDYALQFAEKYRSTVEIPNNKDYILLDIRKLLFDGDIILKEMIYDPKADRLRHADAHTVSTSNNAYTVIFDGKDCKAFINSKLMKFGYYPLSRSLSKLDSFLINIMSNIKILRSCVNGEYSYFLSTEEIGRPAKIYLGENVVKRLYESDDRSIRRDSLKVPVPLIVFREMLQKYTSTLQYRDGSRDTSTDMSFRLYEQL